LKVARRFDAGSRDRNDFRAVGTAETASLLSKLQIFVAANGD
jgi:hypothetical protein